ncbi:adenylate kinase [Mycoplasma phocoeninasale]|uniref:Adenylate kinase n=1 Tax=Mycoplasma phocoeninasale TaxID=2726117 RepID=A0A858TZE4_9MOLU|nr:adenylate kinase [Mycoplasma phocoeninasale]MBN0970728.1 adenylate kinase [Mycoplasma phocoeninasale]QJG66164.1 adenylate kinase [Mycoplasma phocoeninasale]
MIKHKPNLIFLGAPGAGKGSIATLLVKRHQYFQLSTGDMFRQEIKNNTPLGNRVKEILDSGKYVDDTITNEIVKSRLIDLVKDGVAFILDGYPRTFDQATFLDSLENQNVKIDKVILLKITKDQIIERLSKRRICPNCKTIYHMDLFTPLENDLCVKCHTKVIKRPDDEPEVIEKRLKIYEMQTECLIQYYKEKNMLVEVNGYQEIEKVYSDVEDALKW